MPESNTQTVWISHTNQRERYHTNKECRYVNGDYLEREPEQLQDHYELCLNCAESMQTSHEWDRDCPFCGKGIKALREHLPCDGVGKEDPSQA